MRRLLPLLAMALLSAMPARAQTVLTSAAPETTSVTVYRDPDRRDGAINARFPQGFALISEKRRITLPAGNATIRFEGVADGMIAVSAVVTGLPGGVTQKNRDARLLSPAALVDGSIGHAVHLRRTNRQTGAVVEQEAIIRSSASNALVLETAEGVEGLRCSGLPETLAYDVLPAGLSAKPVLSVDTTSPAAAVADVTLTYLATGFDWSAAYVARIAPDGRHLNLSAWLTVANGNAAAFPGAGLLAVAGRIERQTPPYQPGEMARPAYLLLQCWRFDGYAAPGDKPALQMVAAPPPPPPPAFAAESIMVTASRRVAQQEDLGDLKLYRVPMAVDISPRAQKQVALLDLPVIAFTSYYAGQIAATGPAQPARPLTRMIRFVNRRDSGAGVPLPSGAVALFAPRGDEQLLSAQARMADYAVGETVEMEAGASPQRQVALTIDANGDHHLLLTNAGSDPLVAEITLTNEGDQRLLSPSKKLVRRDGHWLWKQVVPANGTARLDYRLRPRGK